MVSAAVAPVFEVPGHSVTLRVVAKVDRQASPDELTPMGRRRASPEKLDRQRRNRAASRGPRVRNKGAGRIAVEPTDAEGKPVDPYKFADAEVRPTLLSVACSDMWVDDILTALARRRPDGKPVIPYACKTTVTTNTEGRPVAQVRLTTSPSRLLDLVDRAGVYPPAVTDPANQMRPCCCAKCRSEDKRRSRLYPGIYVRRGLSYECHHDRQHMDPAAVALLPEDEQYLLAESRVRERNVQVYDDHPATGRRQPQRIVDRRDAAKVDAEPWRRIRVDEWGLESRTAVEAMLAHQWTYVSGEVKAKLVPRRLVTVGDVFDFLHTYGRRLSEVAGITPGMGSEVRERLAECVEHGRPLTVAERRSEERARLLVAAMNEATAATISPSKF